MIGRQSDTHESDVERWERQAGNSKRVRKVSE